MFPSPSTDGSFEILRVAAGNNPLFEWNSEPGTSAVALLRDFQSETNRLLLLQFCVFASDQRFVLCTRSVDSVILILTTQMPFLIIVSWPPLITNILRATWIIKWQSLENTPLIWGVYGRGNWELWWYHKEVRLEKVALETKLFQWKPIARV